MNSTILTKNNKKIYIFDDLLNLSFRNRIYNFVKNSSFRVKGYDNEVVENHHPTLISLYSMDDLFSLGFSKFPEHITKVVNINDNYIVENILINLCKPDDIFHVHTDTYLKDSWTLIYYINLNWDVEWGGDTIFLDENRKIEYTSQYTPGRFLLFDSTIPHLIRPSTRLSPDYRFTMAIRFISK
jgi:esterase/lipase superfamily enzyme